MQAIVHWIVKRFVEIHIALDLKMSQVVHKIVL